MPSRGRLKEFTLLISQGLQLLDLLTVVSCGFAAYAIRFGDWHLPDQYKLGIALTGLLVLLIFPRFNLYTSRRGVSFPILARHLALAWATTVLVLITLAFAAQLGNNYSRLWAGAWISLALGALLSVRLAVHILLVQLRRRGWNQRQVVIFGAGTLGRKTAAHLGQTNPAGYELVAFWDDNRQLEGSLVEGKPVLFTDSAIESLLVQDNLDEVWVALSGEAEERIQAVQHLLRHSTVSIRLIPNHFTEQLLQQNLSRVVGIPMVNLSVSPMRGVNRIVKAIEDHTLALLLLIVLSPLMIAAAIAVRLSSPGPVIYNQQRVGWNGQRFMMHKFRSMAQGASSESETWVDTENKPTTAVGRFLRRTGVDELPQLLNVLKGEMSLVGPRPELPHFVEEFKQTVPGYMKKHLVKAGITGWAQINGLRGDTDLHQRIAHDLYYIEQWSVWMDLKILAATLVRGVWTDNPT